MVTITTKRGIIELAHIEPDDAETIKANCGHGIPLLDDCRDCELEAIQEEVKSMIDKAWEITTDCPMCSERTYFIFPLGELWVCEACAKEAENGG